MSINRPERMSGAVSGHALLPVQVIVALHFLSLGDSSDDVQPDTKIGSKVDE